jgi:hypothetical protein
MLLKITLIISVLIIVNLLLLKFSCNRTGKRTKVTKRPIVFTPKITIEQAQQELAPTGS